MIDGESLTIHFVDRRGEFVDAMDALLDPASHNHHHHHDHHADIVTSVGRVEDVPRVPGIAFVSPANSIGFMDGGIDAVYSSMFPGIQETVQSKIAEIGMSTFGGRFYLPVGSAIVVDAADQSKRGGGVQLVSAPTMFQPTDVSHTRNAYHAMMAALCVVSKYNSYMMEEGTSPVIQALVCPALCTGYGRMPAAVAARQMLDAVDDFTRGSNFRPAQVGNLGDPRCYLTGPLNTYTD